MRLNRHPTIFGILCRNVSMNCRGGNVRFHAIALCDRDGDLTFELAPKAGGDNRIRTGSQSDDQLNESARPTIKVPGRRLDMMLPRPIRRPLGIKIDTQGAEPLVVAGAPLSLPKPIWCRWNSALWPVPPGRRRGWLDRFLSRPLSRGKRRRRRGF